MLVCSENLCTFQNKMSEEATITIQSCILLFKKTDLGRFGGEMKWTTAVATSEGKRRLELIKIIRTEFEEEAQKCDDEQLELL